MTSVAPTAGWVDDYLARIDVTRPVSADLQALRDLQAAHLLAVPFENLSIHLGEPIVLDEAALVTKVARLHRGGFCYELNGAFAGLLTALGFRVSLLSARVFGAGEQPGPPSAPPSLNPRCVSACVSAQGETITWFLRPAGAQGQLLVRGIRC